MERNEEDEQNTKSFFAEKYISIFGDIDNLKQGLILIFNLILGILNRILQIVYYCMKKYAKNKEKNGFGVDTIRQASLTFCILPTAIDAFMIGLYCLLHSEKNLTVSLKIKNFFMFIFSMEFLFPLGVHLSLRTKYSYNSDNILITMRLVNALHFLFVALPQVLIVPINSSIVDKFEGIDIASLICSIIFILWCVGYYFICITNQDGYEEMITNFSEKHKSE